MGNFRRWLFESQGMERDKKISDLWNKTFDALGVEGLERDDVMPWSLSKITIGQKNPTGPNKSVFRGKQAALKRLTRANIFQELGNLDPELKQTATDVQGWLGMNDDDKSNNGSTTVGTLLQKLYGPYFNKLVGSSYPNQTDDAKLKKAPPQPPAAQANNVPAPEQPQNPMGQPPMPGMGQPPMPGMQPMGGF